jgi:CRISPR-associated Csx2 family protein
MAKILISTLGVGQLDKNAEFGRTYRTASYQIDGQPYKSSFVASVLYKHLKLDGIIFIGTVKSMWEEVYRFFCEQNNHNLDEEYWLKLAEKISILNHSSSLDELDLIRVNGVLGERSQCVLIKYGLNEDELWKNFDQVIQVVNCLKKRDEIYIDISNSFRSLSLFLFLVLVFIKDIPSEREIKISGVYYGMLDVIGELGYAPIVDLKPLFQITDWIKGTYSLKSYGDGFLIAELLEQQGEIALAKNLRSFSQAVNLGYSPTVQEQVESLQKTLKKRQVKAPFKYLKKFVENFLKPFSQKHESDFQLELASWYFENQRYATGYLTMTEAILTYLCEINTKDPDTYSERELMKDLIFNHPSHKSSRLSQLYKEINEIRKRIAHPVIGFTEANLSDNIKKADSYHKELKSIFKSGTWGEDLFRRRNS